MARHLKNTDDNGFSVVTILLVILVVGLIGVVGWLVMDKQKDSKSDKPTTAQSTQSETVIDKNQIDPKQESIPTGWKKYTENKNFEFIYPEKWSKVIKVEEFPLSHVFSIRYVGDVKLNSKKDGWVHARDAVGETAGADAVVTKEKSPSISVWRFGFGDAGFGSFIPTFSVGDRVFQITTESFCDGEVNNPGCLGFDEYMTDYNNLVESIKAK